MRGFESQLCWLVIKNTWNEFGEHNNLCLPQLIITHRDSCQITKTKRTNRLAIISKLGKQPNFQSFRILLEAIRMLRYISFFMETIEAKEFWKKLQVYFVAQVFSNKSKFFQWENFENRFFLNFCFASFHCLKALTGCLEKLEISV